MSEEVEGTRASEDQQVNCNGKLQNLVDAVSTSSLVNYKAASSKLVSQ